MHFFEAIVKPPKIEPRAESSCRTSSRGSRFCVLRGARRPNRGRRPACRSIGDYFGRERRLRPEPAESRACPWSAAGAGGQKAVGGFRPGRHLPAPRTVADLPPVGGILTARRRQPALARTASCAQPRHPERGGGRDADAGCASRTARISSSRSALRVVEIEEDGRRGATRSGGWLTRTGPRRALIIEPDLRKLDLTVREFLSLDRLRAGNSGPIIGPKAAKLGELRQHFPDAWCAASRSPSGFSAGRFSTGPTRRATRPSARGWAVIPQARSAGGGVAEEAWAAARTCAPSLRHDPPHRSRPEFRGSAGGHGAGVRPGFKGGLFVRSDTNVEDLPVHRRRPQPDPAERGRLRHCAGDRRGLGVAVHRAVVCLAPAAMKRPEHVYPAVLLMRTVPSEKSGVMVTQDVDTGDPGVLSVAVTRACPGPSTARRRSPSRRHPATAVRLLAAATAPRMLVPLPTGGVVRQPATGRETLLQPGEIEAARRVRRR